MTKPKPIDLDAVCRRMNYIDRLPPYARAVANGLPRLDWLPYALADGCTTQEEAEEWTRRQIGQTVLGFHSEL